MNITSPGSLTFKPVPISQSLKADVDGAIQTFALTILMSAIQQTMRHQYKWFDGECKDAKLKMYQLLQ